MVDVSRWLAEQGLGHHAEAFAENGIAADILRELTDADLKELGLNLGDRKRLLKAIGTLDAGLAQHRTETTEPTAAPAVPREAERRQLTVLFCDLVGSTELATRLDPEDMGAVMSAYHRATAAVIERFDGHVARYLGDGVLAYFGWPKAHEDDAERAVRAGLGLVGAVARLEPHEEVRLQARVGVATGQVVVGDLVGEGAARDEAVVGETPNLAARLQTLAAPESVVISQATRQLVRGLFELEDLGPQRLKGFAEPLAVWRVASESRTGDRFDALRGKTLTPLVGREHELGLLLERWAWAKTGEGQVMLISGEPGIGKSRLVRALRERLQGERYTPLSHYCSPYHTNSMLYPVIGLLERAAGLRDEPLEQRPAKLEQLLADHMSRLDQAMPLIAALLSLPTGERYPALNLTPERQKRRTLETLVEQLEGLARRQPVLAIYEDIHWIDPSTRELLDLVVERVRHLRVLALMTFRPEFSPPWVGHAHVASLVLNRLGRPQGEALVDGLTDTKALPKELREQILAKTDGVPLFVEELTKTVLESGLLTDAGDHYELRGSLPTLAIPATLHDSLMARLDRLAQAKEIAQLGAVIGHEFSQELIAAVAAWPQHKLDQALQELVRSQLVFHRGVPPGAIYTFKHSMVQDVAYQSLLKTRREQLHARIARVLEERFPEASATQPELLAQHYTAAGLHDKAVEHWHRAGQRASKRSANLEAIAHLTRGLELARALPDPMKSARQELELQVALGEPLVAAKGYGAPAAGATYTRALELCRQVGETPHLFPTVWGLWHFYCGQGAFQTARDLSHELLRQAEQRADPALLVAAHQALGQSLHRLGEFTAALLHLEQARAGLDSGPGSLPHLRYAIAPGVHCLAILAQLQWCLGFPDQALQRISEALHSARELSHLHSLTYCMFFAVRVHLLRGETREADKLAKAALALSTKHGFTFWTPMVSFLQGWSLCLQGRGTEGIAPMRAGFTRALATGGKITRPVFYALLAEAYGRVGRLDKAWRMLDCALRAVAESGQRHHEAETYRIKGQLHLRAANPEVEHAEACFQRALDIARHQRANPGSCAPPPASPGCGQIRAGGLRLMICSRRSTTGSPRAWTPPISEMPRPCSTSWHERRMFGHLILAESMRSAGRLPTTL